MWVLNYCCVEMKKGLCMWPDVVLHLALMSHSHAASCRAHRDSLPYASNLGWHFECLARAVRQHQLFLGKKGKMYNVVAWSG